MSYEKDDAQEALWVCIIWYVIYRA